MHTLYQWLGSAPFTLSMSAGFFSFFAHCGMVSVLEDEGLVPMKITGASAGALVGACWAAGCSSTVLKARLFTLAREDFWDPGLGPGLLRGERFRKVLRDLCDDALLENGRIPVALSVTDVFSWSVSALRSGKLAEAVSASCAVPLLFQPVRIGPRYYLDGGLKDRHGLAGVGEGERVFYHHIASRSPWRRKSSAALALPVGKNLVSLTIHDLPRSGPSRLEEGRVAFEQARSAMRLALEKKVENNRVEVCVTA